MSLLEIFLLNTDITKNEKICFFHLFIFTLQLLDSSDLGISKWSWKKLKNYFLKTFWGILLFTLILATKMFWQKLYQLLRFKVTTGFNFLLIFTKLVNQSWKAQHSFNFVKKYSFIKKWLSKWALLAHQRLSIWHFIAKCLIVKSFQV